MAQPPVSQTGSVQPHSTTAKVMHWGFGLLFVYALTKQLDDLEELEDFGLLQYEMVFAAVFLLLLLARFVYMQLTRPTALPASAPRRFRRLARAVHLSMYAGLALTALTGLAIGGLYWNGTRHSSTMDLLLVVHEIVIQLSLGLVVGHAVAALYHRRQRDGLWDSMVPFWKESTGPNSSD